MLLIRLPAGATRSGDRYAATLSPAVASKLTDIPEGVALNEWQCSHVTRLLVVADAGAGVVYTVNVHTGNYSKTIDDPTMKPNSSLPVGINGIKIHDEYLYYTSTAQKLFSRTPIDTTSGTPTGPAEIIATNVPGDDFSLDQAGDAYVAENPWDVVAKVTPGGEVSVVAAQGLNSSLAATTLTSPPGVTFATTSQGFSAT